METGSCRDLQRAVSSSALSRMKHEGVAPCAAAEKQQWPIRCGRWPGCARRRQLRVGFMRLCVGGKTCFKLMTR
jgi:hypothetical protein